ncbi:MAG: hypothetical protein WCS18_05095 [Sphaerochaetaceae bacterium]
MKVSEVIIATESGLVTYRTGREEASPLMSLYPLGGRLFEVSNDYVYIKIILDNGTVFEYWFYKKFKTNFRSGGLFVDLFIDPIGDQLHQTAWITHDGNYTPCEHVKIGGSRSKKGVHPVSKEMADELLRAMLVFAGTSARKAAIIKESVALFGKSAYYKDDDLTPKNRKLFDFCLTRRIER